MACYDACLNLISQVHLPLYYHSVCLCACVLRMHMKRTRARALCVGWEGLCRVDSFTVNSEPGVFQIQGLLGAPPNVMLSEVNNQYNIYTFTQQIQYHP